MSIAIDLIQHKIEDNAVATVVAEKCDLEQKNDDELSEISLNSNEIGHKKAKKSVRFPNELIKDYSEPPKKWKHGSHTTTDLLESYYNSCIRNKCRPLSKLVQQLRALQDLDGINGEKVNVLNLKKERLDLKQVEALEEVFKRLSFKAIDFEQAYFYGEETLSTLFEILDFYDTCEKLILSNVNMINLSGWQALSRYLRRSSCLEQIDLKGYLFRDHFRLAHLVRAFRMNSYLRVLHLENSNMCGKYLVILLNSIKDNHYLKELYLCENKIQAGDGFYFGVWLKEFKTLELFDLRSNNLQDLGLSHICSGLSEQTNASNGLKTLILANNQLSINGMSYISKALIHNQSLRCLNLSQNLISNEGMFALKEALIANHYLNTLILVKTKISDEGVVSLAEYLAETQTLTRLDLRENDIHLAGIMALASSLKFNKTLTRLDLDKDFKKDSTVKDYVDQFKRLYQDISEYCDRNRLYRMELEEQLENIINLDLKIPKQEQESTPPLSPFVNEDDYQIVDDNPSNEQSNDITTNTSFECVDSSDLSEMSDLLNEIELKIENISMNTTQDDDDDDNGEVSAQAAATEIMLLSSLFKNDEDLSGDELDININPKEKQQQTNNEIEINVDISNRVKTSPILNSISENEIDFDHSVQQWPVELDEQLMEQTQINSTNIPESFVSIKDEQTIETQNENDTSLCSLEIKDNFANLKEASLSALMHSINENHFQMYPSITQDHLVNEVEQVLKPQFECKHTHSDVEEELLQNVELH